MNIVVIDGQGGRIGKTIIELIRKKMPHVNITGVGANSIASSAMLKAGATACATGENAIIFNCGKADVICGAMGIAFANSMHGEISPAMAQAVSQSEALKLMIPVRSCGVRVMGTKDKSIQEYVVEMIEIIEAM